MSKITGIYKIESPSGRIYIGQAVDITRRFKEYKNIKKSKLQIKLHRSFNKYGIENHKFEIVEETISEDLNNRERYWQEFYEVISKKGLNCTLVKSDDKSGKLSEETKLKISLANTGNFHNEETRAKMGIKNKGRIASQETRDKMSKSRTGVKLSEEHVKSISDGKKGVLFSDEHKQNLSNKKLERFKDKSKHPRSKKVINTETGKIFNTISEAALSINVKCHTLTNWLKNSHRNKSNLIFLKDE